ncbi:LacI family DNA-binding transcriptional regulator [Arcanobacterium bovis]|uniref:LacI family transcriptional regulator n=1 Tax=Arcanobacterium bovis TaxID=2529275 RepID=A0A4Q9V132_9ACTO|nr:LacI family DNA-binding transcriptional regulator [Arcanobacterium bovis]TBW22800.1 LacI family transcriptional regulator [Arcanobacterium bovis]
MDRDNRISKPSQEGNAADIARTLGVSRAAVSYALNGKPGVSARTRQMILSLAEKKGMEIPQKALNWKTTKPLVGLILADLSNPFYQELGVAVSNRARWHGYDAYLSHTGDDPLELLTTVRAMASHHVDGIILTATQDGDAAVVQELRKWNIPYVQVSRKIPTVQGAFVGIDNKAASKDIALHMASHGYEKIALVVGPRRSSASNDRYAGYLDGLVESGIFVPQQWIVRTSLGIDGGLKAAQYLRSLDRGLPEAIICGSDAIALGIIQDFTAQGINIPADVAICGFDGVMSQRSADFSLTTVVQPVDDMAENAVMYLDDLIRNKAITPHEVICQYSLRIGNSCRCQL